ncbi:MAG: hypothetical protein PHD21_06275 [Flavobacteriales bacterium]|nr:hypothetical protein [Flavobacteriales bacterium]
MDIFSELLKPEVQEYIRSESVQKAFLHSVVKNPFPEIPFSVLMNQIKGILKSKNKLPHLSKNRQIIYPEGISIEQCSSLHTAQYKASLIGQIQRGADLTGGFGVDSMSFSEKSDTWDYFEINQTLANIVRHNIAVIGHSNVNVHAADGIKSISQTSQKYDFIYSDPARRDKNASKVFSIKDCTPDVSDYQDVLLQAAPMVMTKLSPMLDISMAINEMHHVSEVHVVGVRGEVKEILLIQKRDFVGVPHIYSVDFFAEKEKPYVFSSVFQKNTSMCNSLPKKYIYDISATMRKASLGDEYAESLGLEKLHPNTLLYTSEKCIENFCGRVFCVVAEVNKKTVASFLTQGKANIICRNFSDTAELLHKKWKVKNGGDDFILSFKDIENKYRTLYANKVKFS